MDIQFWDTRRDFSSADRVDKCRRLDLSRDWIIMMSYKSSLRSTPPPPATRGRCGDDEEAVEAAGVLANSKSDEAAAANEGIVAVLRFIFVWLFLVL